MTTVDEEVKARSISVRSVAQLLAPLAGVALVLVLAGLTTDTFYSRGSLDLVLFQLGIIGITAIGQTFVLLVGGIDLSIGAVIGLTSVIIATQTDGSNDRLLGAVLIALVAGLVVGLVNGGLVLLRQVPPFVATFATFVLVQGIITAWTEGAPAGEIPSALRPLGSGDFLGVQTPVWIFAGLALAAGLLLSRSALGRRIYATGANRRATEMSGIRVLGVIAFAYVLSALLAVLAGLVNAGYVGHVDSQLSRTLNLESIAAAVIGGVALSGGRGNIIQTVTGVAFLAVLLVWMVQLGAGAGGQLVVVGAAILLAASLQNTNLLRRPNQ